MAKEKKFTMSSELIEQFNLIGQIVMDKCQCSSEQANKKLIIPYKIVNDILIEKIKNGE